MHLWWGQDRNTCRPCRLGWHSECDPRQFFCECSTADCWDRLLLQRRRTDKRGNR